MKEHENTDRELARLTQQLPLPALSALDLAKVRRRVVDAAGGVELTNVRKARVARVLLPITFFAASVIALISISAVRTSGTHTSPAPVAAPKDGLASSVPPARKAKLHTHDSVAFARVGEQPDEIVRLDSGKLTVEVDQLSSGQRFRVITGDAEVEVHGTAFDIESVHDHLTHVRVLHGVVEVRAQGARPVFLGAGDEWRPKLSANKPVQIGHRTSLKIRSSLAKVAAPKLQSPIVSSPEPRLASGAAIAGSTVVGSPAVVQSTAPTAKAAVKTESSFSPSAAEVTFQQGWSALVANHPEEAARAFAQASKTASGSALGEDANFWEGVALARAGKSLEAIATMSHFLVLHVGSPRAGETSAMLGWLLLKKGDKAAAKIRFEAAANDRVPAVRTSAQRGLAALTAL